MFHKALELQFKEGTTLELTFADGQVKAYDLAVLFDRFPQLTALRERELFLQGRLTGFYGIIWNDELDLAAETVYCDGLTVRTVAPAANMQAGAALRQARAELGITQAELSAQSGLDQSDISKIERGLANPSLATLHRLAAALGRELHISFI